MIHSVALRQEDTRAWKLDLASWVARITLRPLQLLIASPTLLFLLALTAMLLRHPHVRFYSIDRIAFGVLVAAVVGRALILRHAFVIFERASLPMLGLSILVLASIVGRPVDEETWSLLASKFIVPFVLFHVAILVFTEEKRLKVFEIYSLIVLAYLSFIAIMFLCGWHWLIFPKFILNESLGLHTDRARGPLLQAVANGVSLNMLALVAVHAYKRASVRRPVIVALILLVPIAILATMTRTVWLSFGATILAVLFISKSRHVRLVSGSIFVVLLFCLAIASAPSQFASRLKDRLRESGPVEFREAVYVGSWEMFLRRPVLGCGFHEMPAELPKYVSGYHEKVIYPHNTYLELLVENGIIGFGLYVWLMYEMWRLGKARIPETEHNGFLNRHFHQMWPIMLGVYWINAAVVVMSYQFVNALLFTMAGMLAAQRRRTQAVHPC